MAVKVMWRKEFGFLHGADAQIVANEIEQIGESGVTPAQILDYARDENTELHKCFEWDDGKAAELYRMDQARTIIRCIVIKNEPEEYTEEKNLPPIRFFHSVPPIDEEPRTYQTVNVIVRDEKKYNAVLEEAYKALQSFKAKYRYLAELEDVIEAIDNLNM